MTRLPCLLALPIAAAAFSHRLGSRGPDGEHPHEAPVIAASAAPSLPVSLLQLGIGRSAAETGQDRGAEAWALAGIHSPEWEAAVFAARTNTSPAIVPNVSDRVWYKDYYAGKPHNSLEELSWTTNATDPTPEQLRKRAEREQHWLDKVYPPYQAYVDESNQYFSEDFPYNNNDLDNFTRLRSLDEAAPSKAVHMKSQPKTQEAATDDAGSATDSAPDPALEVSLNATEPDAATDAEAPDQDAPDSAMDSRRASSSGAQAIAAGDAKAGSGSVPDSGKDSSSDGADEPDSAKDSAEDSAKDYARESTKDSAEDSADDSAEDSGRQASSSGAQSATAGDTEAGAGSTPDSAPDSSAESAEPVAVEGGEAPGQRASSSSG